MIYGPREADGEDRRKVSCGGQGEDHGQTADELTTPPDELTTPPDELTTPPDEPDGLTAQTVVLEGSTAPTGLPARLLDRLGLAICGGDLETGSVVRIDQLQERYGVSRSVVREATGGWLRWVWLPRVAGSGCRCWRR